MEEITSGSISHREINNFCKNPTKKSFDKLPSDTIQLFLKLSEFCITKKRGNVMLAKIILNFSQLHALLSCLKFLSTSEIVKLVDKKAKMPRLIIFLDNRIIPSFEVSYNTEFSEQYFIIQTDSKLGVDKEIALYYTDVKEYFREILLTRKLNRVEIILSEKSPPRIMYEAQVGIVWDNEDCIQCLYNNTGKNCKKLLKENCVQKIRYQPENPIYKLYKPYYKYSKAKPSINSLQQLKQKQLNPLQLLLEKQKKLKACKVCELQFSESECPACADFAKSGVNVSSASQVQWTVPGISFGI